MGRLPDNPSMSDATPRVSILIPNYNNGIESSRDGQTDLLGDLLRSLFDTLDSDPTPLEIIAYDDGSTDDSLETLRDFAGRTWRGGEPFLRLIEAEHCGVLAKTANTMVAASRGDILVRLDGDTQMLTPHWVAKLVRVFDGAPARLGVVGPKQLATSGVIHAFGDWVLHPKGYHHIAAGLPRDAVTRPIECDHVMGCFYCCKRAVHDEIGGYDENFLRGQTVDFGLRARLAGWSCIAVPHIEFVHRHGERGNRDTRADQMEGKLHTMGVFREKWGFDRLAPDLDAVRERYAGTPLLWNAEVFGVTTDELDEPVLRTEPLTIENSQWGRYASDEAYRGHVDVRVKIALHVIEQVGRPKRVALIGGGHCAAAGPLAHLLANQGLTVSAVDRDAAAVAFARTCVKNQDYPAAAPDFLEQAGPSVLPLGDASCEMALVYNRMEHHPNPVGLLAEIRRCLVPGGVVVVVAARPGGIGDRGYLPRQLAQQIAHAAGWVLLTDPGNADPKGPVIMVGRRDETVVPTVKATATPQPRLAEPQAA